jgi:DNA-directed RNA polymerase specialized sigma24 family protein
MPASTPDRPGLPAAPNLTGDSLAWPASALQAADTAFAALTCDPDPLTLNCDGLTPSPGADPTRRRAGLGLPDGEVSLRVLRDWMLAHPKRYAARDAVWRELAIRARLGEPQWIIAAVGMAMPALIRCAGRLAAGYRGDPNDLDAEVLTGFLEALRGRLDLDRPGLYARLCWAAYRAGHAARRADENYLLLDDLDAALGSKTPQLPYGHPDLLVQRAAALQLIDSDDAELFIQVRLAHRAIEPIAVARDISVDTLRRRLDRATARLAEALAGGLLTAAVSTETVAALAHKAERRVKIRAARRVAEHRAAEPLPPAHGTSTSTAA